MVASQLLFNLFARPLPPSRLEWNGPIDYQRFFIAIYRSSIAILFSSNGCLSGQTPGKRVVGIRVIKVGGYSLRFLDVLLRNLMRFVDFLPVFYGVGAASLLVTSRCQRLGDVVAGTLVVHQEPSGADGLLTPLPAADSVRRTGVSGGAVVRGTRADG